VKTGPLGRATASAAVATVLMTTDGGAVTSPTPTPDPCATASAAPVSPASSSCLPSARTGTAGAAGIGDPYFSQAGNGGYDVQNYLVDLAYAPKTKSVDATVTITATATSDLTSFDLDFRGPQIMSLTVNGKPAPYRRQGQELAITPPHGLTGNAPFTTVVHYAGQPAPLGTPKLGMYGWVPSRDGAVVVSEPDGAPSWLPVNDHPLDKATYTFRITVPTGLQVLANGEPDQPIVNADSTTTYRWTERNPMASYLAMIAIGHFEIRRGMAGPIPVITAVDPKFAKAAGRLYDTTVEAVKWESSIFGPYPFASAGGIIDDTKLGYALETQERPVYGGFVPDADFIVHELAHQWLGDSVSLTKWQDIWLAEGFSTYAEWLWNERAGKDSARKVFKRYYRQPGTSAIFNPPAGAPGKDQLFAFSVYIRGAMCLEALRLRVGDTAFFKILRSWAAPHKYGNATTAQFIALAEQISHRHLGPLFDNWLMAKGKPAK
jgi:aminopeptidase N